MKISGIFSAALFVTGVWATGSNVTSSSSFNVTDSFNLTAINGTWNLQAVPKQMLTKIQSLSKMYNVSISCPQVYVTGNSTNASYIQPSIQFGWYDPTTKKSESANITLSGILTLDEGNATDANFTAQFSVPPAAENQTSSTSSMIKMLATTYSGGNSSNPLPHGTDLWGNITVKLISTMNNNITDAIFITAYNFTATDMDDDYYDLDEMDDFNTTTSQDDPMDYAVPFLFTNETLKLTNSSFNTLVKSLGPEAANLTMLTGNCTASSKKN